MKLLRPARAQKRNPAKSWEVFPVPFFPFLILHHVSFLHGNPLKRDYVSEITSSSNKHFTFNHCIFARHNTLRCCGPRLKLCFFFSVSVGNCSLVVCGLTLKLFFQTELRRLGKRKTLSKQNGVNTSCETAHFGTHLSGISEYSVLCKTSLYSHTTYRWSLLKTTSCLAK